MKIEAFLEKNHISLKPEEWASCQTALEIMHQAKEEIHNHHHIYGLLDHLQDFMKTEEYHTIKQEIRWDVLILTICWHDVWRSKHEPNGILSYLWQSFWEGMGSARMFKAHAKKAGIAPAVARQVFYAIRKHTSFQILERKTWEAKILWDLDCMDMFSLKRFNQLRHRFFQKKYRPFLNFAKRMIRSYAETKINHKLYFAFFRLKIDKAQNKFAREIKKFISILNKKITQ